jgi:hypothetical protein
MLLLLLLLRWPADCIKSFEIMQLALPAGQTKKKTDGHSRGMDGALQFRYGTTYAPM